MLVWGWRGRGRRRRGERGWAVREEKHRVAGSVLLYYPGEEDRDHGSRYGWDYIGVYTEFPGNMKNMIPRSVVARISAVDQRVILNG